MLSEKDMCMCIDAHTHCVELVFVFFCPSLCLCVVVSEDMYDGGTRVHTGSLILKANLTLCYFVFLCLSLSFFVSVSCCF